MHEQTAQMQSLVRATIAVLVTRPGKCCITGIVLTEDETEELLLALKSQFPSLA